MKISVFSSETAESASLVRSDKKLELAERSVAESGAGKTGCMNQLNGYTVMTSGYKKPVEVPHKFSTEAQQAFMAAYNQLKCAAGTREPILFIDGVHPTQGTKQAYGWIPKDLRTVVATTGGRTRLNLMGALNLNDIGNTVIREYDTISERGKYRSVLHRGP